jgi:hypothetical protein
MAMWGWISTRSVLVALAFCAPILCGSGAAQAQSTDETAAGLALDRFHSLAAHSDAAYFDAFAPDAVFIGTDPKERWTLPELKATFGPLFAQGKGFTYTPRERHVAIAPDPCRCVAWFDEILDSQKYGTSRSTGLLVKKAGRWLVSRYALTFTMPNELSGRFTDEIKAFEAKK